MQITELRLAGFKSFVDPARAPIEPGLTGVVGPNGCGKSNLLEAVRWVMGAASAKAMRAEDMDDVIFAGSGGRPAREHAEVSVLIADGPNGDALEVTRRIRRGLGSTYRVNGKETRAKDVQLLFADAATGANSPALVRQGQINDLIAAKPENRRRIIEEAAGIAGLHARRHDADLKLRAAEANLTRLDEILIEIEGQAANLRKQARQAERYRGLADTLRRTEALLFHRRWQDARATTAEAEAALREAERAVAEKAALASAAARGVENAREALPALREEEMVAAAILRRLEGVRVGLERDVADAEAALARIDADARRLEADLARDAGLETDAVAAIDKLAAEAAALGATDSEEPALLAAREEAARTDAARTLAEQALEALAASAAAARAEAAAYAEAQRQAAQRRARLDERARALAALRAALPDPESLATRQTEARAKADATQAASAAARGALAELESALKRAETADDAAWSPYRAAESAERDLAAEVRALDKLAPPEHSSFPPVLAAIEVAAGYERALAAALGDDLDASTHRDAPAHWAGADAADFAWPAGVEPLAPQVKAPPQLAARLARVGVTDDGAALIKTLPPGTRLVSKAGALWRWDGFSRTPAAAQPAAARLEHKTRLAQARTDLALATKKLATAKAAFEKARAARADAETRTRAARADAPKLAAAAADAAQALERLDAEAARLDQRRADLDAQAAALALETADEAAPLAPPSQSVDESALVTARADAQTARAAAIAAHAAVEGIVRAQAARAQRVATIAADITAWRGRAATAAARRDALTRDLAAAQAARASAADAPETARARLLAIADEAEIAEARRRAGADSLAQAETEARRAETDARAAESAHAAAREARAGAEARLSAAAQRLDDVVQQAVDQTGSAPEALADLAASLIATPLARAPLADIEKRLERLRAERDAGGPVNLRAEEELTEAEARLATLRTEKADVAAAVAKLRGAITRLNNEGRARLVAAFEQVNTNFAMLFATLFEGGAAALKLTESDDPLAAGLEIFAQPPGKKLAQLSLMSGGEQALTAAALIFAVFLANPAPLCVLDEVDAPLDDANVDRFCRLLEEMRVRTSTRFLVITHNPVTMSRMDRLYGVTMPEQGVSQLVSVDLRLARDIAGVA